MPSPQSSVASDVEVLATANTKRKKPRVLRVKSADRTEKETHELLQAWAPKLSKLWGVSKRKKEKSGTISILRIKKGVQKARECYSR